MLDSYCCFPLQAVNGATLRLTNTEFRHCGQSLVLGRYCTHMHMANRQEDSYIIDNSIHNGFQRATTLHGAHLSYFQRLFVLARYLLFLQERTSLR